MNISVHEHNNAFYCGSGTPWAHAWSAQKLVSAAVVAATGGTYEVSAPVEEEKTKKTAKSKK